MSSTVTKVLRRLEVQHDGVFYADRPPTAWGNRDIWPVPLEQRRFTAISYLSFWVIAVGSPSAWAFGGSAIALGLSPGYAIGSVVTGSALLTIVAYLCGFVGSHLHLGFTAMARVSFGLRGAYLPILLLVFENIIFFGINAYFGGLSMVIILNSWSPDFMNMANTLPASAGITTRNLIGFVIYFATIIPTLFIHPSKLRFLVWPSAAMIAAAFIGLFGWAISANGGSPGNLLHPTKQLSSTNRGFLFLYFMSSAMGSTTGYASRITDWTRFAKAPHTPTIPMFVALPIAASLTAVLGILATSAVHTKYHVVQWNPLSLILYVQETQYTAGCRAATFFAGLGIFMSLLTNNLMSKVVCAGMDLAGLWPKYINTRRGSIIVCVVGILCQPWRFVTQPSAFVSVLSAFGVFLAPMTGVLICDYWLIRRTKWKIPDIFQKEGIYWYMAGVNWRAMVAFLLGLFPSLPGFGATVHGTPKAIDIGWIRLYDICYLAGFFISLAVYYLVCLVSPPPGRGISQTFDGELTEKSLDAQVDDLSAAELGKKHEASAEIMVEHVASM